MQLKKIASIFLAALMIFALAVTAGAENTEIFKVEVEAMTTTSTVSSSPIIYNPGEEFTVKISASQNSGITSLKLFIDYDESVLEIVSNKSRATNLFTDNDLLTDYFTTDGNGYLIFYSDNYPNISTETGVFAELTFVARDVCATESAITVTRFQNSEGNCMVQTIAGLKPVTFVAESTEFNIHAIDAEHATVYPVKCEEDGYTLYTCESCNSDSIKGNIIPATGHHGDAAVEENRVESTCTVKGNYDSVVYCKDCEEELSRTVVTIEQLAEHIPSDAVKENIVESTCSVKGSYDSVVYCKDCEEELSRTVVTIEQLAEHIPSDAVKENIVEATCQEKGSYDEVVYCLADGCNHEISRVNKETEMKPHNWGETTVVEPAYGVEGYSVHTCKDCLTEEKFDKVEALTYILGDTNGNEIVDEEDAIYLLYATLGIDGYPLNQTGDFNGDGEVTDADAIYLLYYTLFGAEEYPLSDMKEAK